MIRSEAKLISRGVDSALTPSQRDELDMLLARDADAAKIARKWEAIGDQLRLDAAKVPVPDSLLAWHDIRREIRRQEPQRAQTRDQFLFGRLQWAGALAGVLIIGSLGWAGWQLWRGDAAMKMSAASEAMPAARVEWVEAEIPGATTMIYTDTESDLTVIWMDLAQNHDPRDS